MERGPRRLQSAWLSTQLLSTTNISFVGQGLFADESVRACAAHMTACKWWASWGGTFPELREVAVRALAQAVGAVTTLIPPGVLYCVSK